MMKYELLVITTHISKVITVEIIHLPGESIAVFSANEIAKVLIRISNFLSGCVFLIQRNANIATIIANIIKNKRCHLV